MDKNINLTISQSDGTTSETASISTNSIDEIRKFLDQLAAAEQELQTGTTIEVDPARMAPYGNEYVTPGGTCYEADNTVDVTIDDEGNLELDEVGDEDMNDKSKMLEAFGKSSQEYLNRMQEYIDQEKDGELNPRTVMAAAKEVADEFKSTMGFKSTDEAADWLGTLFAERHDEIDIDDLPIDDVPDIEDDLPLDPIEDIPDMTDDFMGDISAPSMPAMTPESIMDEGIGDYIDTALQKGVDKFRGAPFPIRFQFKGREAGKQHDFLIDDEYNLSLILNNYDLGTHKKEIISGVKQGQPVKLLGGRMVFSPSSSMDAEPRTMTTTADESVNEDADFDHRDEDNGPADPNGYDRNRDISDFGKKGHSRQHLRRGGPGDNRLADPDEEKMYEEYNKFKTKALQETFGAQGLRPRK